MTEASYELVTPGGTPAELALLVERSLGFLRDLNGKDLDRIGAWFCDESELESIARDVGLEPVRSWSFPFPRRFGKLFIYNEFCVVSRIPA